MKTNHSLHASFLPLCLALFFAPPASRADLTEGDYVYTVADGKATITGFNTSFSGALTITNRLGGYPVTAIRYAAFAACAGLTRIAMLEGIADIGNDAFSSCSGMTDITLSDTVTNLGNYALDHCTALTNVTLFGNLARIGQGAFRN